MKLLPSRQMRAKLAARVALLLSLALWTANRASAEVMEGDHLFILGPGFGVPQNLSLDLTRNADLDRDGRLDGVSFKHRIESFDLSAMAQYIYQVGPSLGIGVDISIARYEGGQVRSFAGSQLSKGPAINPSHLGLSLYSTMYQLLAVARYVMRPERAINPYLLTGIGFNVLKAKSKASGNLKIAGSGFGGSNENIEVVGKTLYNRIATGASAAVGVGIQWSFRKNLTLGGEARWNFASIAEDSFGDAFFMDARGYAWLGWRWSAPL